MYRPTRGNLFIVSSVKLYFSNVHQIKALLSATRKNESIGKIDEVKADFMAFKEEEEE